MCECMCECVCERKRERERGRERERERERETNFGSSCESATVEASEMIFSLSSLSLIKRLANSFISSTIPA